jgi:hypothetical protein
MNYTIASTPSKIRLQLIMDRCGKLRCLFRGKGEVGAWSIQCQFQHQEVALCAEDAIDTCIERNSLVDTLH